MFYEILDKKRLDILPIISGFKKEFYLAGGTALALQLGHRDSIDFDFFKNGDFDTKKLFEELKEAFHDYEIKKVQDEKNTLTIILNENIKISFFAYKYKLLFPLIDEEYLSIASVKDIACMKLSAITSRATEKDYVDLYYILQDISLDELLKLSKEKFSSIDENIILKSLIYFDDVVEEKIVFKNENNISFEKVKQFFIKLLK
jgi:predicted nucleotidyltransferase component of viral defense system